VLLSPPAIVEAQNIDWLSVLLQDPMKRFVWDTPLQKMMRYDLAISDPKFQFAVGYVLQNEGSEYTYIPEGDDPPTKWGITIGDLAEHRQIAVLPTDVQYLTRQEAEQIYYEKYWIFGGVTSWKVAAKLFDHSVNLGIKPATIIAQRAANQFRYIHLKVDGIWGYHTEVAVNSLDANHFLDEYIQYLHQYYSDIVDSKPKKAIFLKGWLRRANRIPSQAGYRT
jgi:lysozyme family protein